MSAEKVLINKLISSANFSIWAIRMKVFLTNCGNGSIITGDDVNNDVNKKALADIQLCLEDGPLLQVHNLTRAHQTWVALKNLYSPKGFSSEFLILKELFSCKLSKFDCMEDFLNTIKRLNDDLTSKEIKLPKQVHEKLWGGKNPAKYQEESFVDRAPKGWRHFEKPKSLVEDTTKKDLATDQSGNEILLSQLEIVPNLTISEDDMLIDLDFDQVFYCTLDDNKQAANSSLGLIVNPSDSSLAEKAIFILDTAATKHIVSDKRYLSNYRSCDKT
ncbi:hypothetical protein EPUL_005826, partial [Erysiphe pulchra]